MTLLEFPKRRAKRTTDPAVEPVSLTRAKKQVEVTGSDHDDHLAFLVQAAREQWEHDTQHILIQHTWTLKLDAFYELKFSERPVDSITSITYYDSGNDSQTLATSVYELDDAENALRLKVDQDWPTTYDRWDAVTITYVAGEHTSSSTVPALDQQAILLLVGHYFEFRDPNMGDAQREISSYESLVRRKLRSSYP